MKPSWWEAKLIEATECTHKLGAPKSYTQNFQETTSACGQRDYKTQKKKLKKEVEEETKEILL